jgi:multiple sugar transport system permease protein
MRKRVINLVLHLVLLAGAVFCALPFFWMVTTSLKTPEEVNRTIPEFLPHQAQWSNYPEAVARAASIGVPFIRCFANSALVALAVTVGVLLTAVLTAYAFSMMNFRGKNILFLLFLAPMMIPFEVTLIPNFMIIQKLGWYDTYLALIVPWTANVFSIFFLRRIFERLPREVYDAARIDGCGDFRFLWSIAVPMAKPALITIGLYTFLGSWNAFLWPLVATSRPELSVIQKGLAGFIQEAGTEYQLLMAAATLTILPVVVIYLLTQRWFRQGAGQLS